MKPTIDILRHPKASWLALWLCVAAWMVAADCVAQREHQPKGGPRSEMPSPNPEGKKGPRHFQPEKFKQQLDLLDKASREESKDIKDIVAEIVPTYKCEVKL